ncbi:putative membrane protein YjcC [Solibacillus isronensis B3W22]|uniref:Putative membrane protein YjcC n=1 Tax=Solibacillus isronensis B3W22 TaxID=1224748 RepID=K1KPU6_9BACL|nr:EAL domain-containing protein [Solibacillus isronensis]AMO84199.1 diguanylate cyclase [Solibacillus silvestris]EKB46175.1 putative membrane protein YjcC [Solibacillus isronensis B3W22]
MKTLVNSKLNYPVDFKEMMQRFLLKSKMIRHLSQSIALKNIIAQEAMNTYFQPIYDVKSNTTFGFEALNRPMALKLFQSADIFYEFVGQTDKVFLFECFCRNLSLVRYHKKWLNYNRKKDFTLFINIHPNVLLDKNYHSGETRALLEKLNISPEQVVFELTERSAVGDFEEFARVLSHYRSQGYRIAVDDVGSGYNSLKTLIYLKPEFIKLDRSLIQNIDQHKTQQQLLTVILNYAIESGTKVIAEGIETKSEYEFIQSVGVHYAQGYAIGHPHEDLIEGKKPLL